MIWILRMFQVKKNKKKMSIHSLRWNESSVNQLHTQQLNVTIKSLTGRYKLVRHFPFICCWCIVNSAYFINQLMETNKWTRDPFRMWKSLSNKIIKIYAFELLNLTLPSKLTKMVISSQRTKSYTVKSKETTRASNIGIQFSIPVFRYWNFSVPRFRY